MTGPSDLERRLKRLEDLDAEMRRRLAQVANTAGKAFQRAGEARSADGSGQSGGGFTVDVFRVTTQIGAGTLGGAYGSGAGIAQVDNGTALVNGTDPAVPIKNYHDKGAKAGAIVGGVLWQGFYWMVDLDSCLNIP